MQKKYVALLPLRGGSKSIKNKNIKLIAGRPLYAWSLAAALESNVFDGVFVSTDSAEIEEDVKKRFPEVDVVNRPKELATDSATTESVMLHFSETHPDFDVMCLLQATSPLTSSEDLIEAKSKFESDNLDSLLTAVEDKRFYWSMDSKPMNYDPMSRPRRQDFEGCYKENGAFYFTGKQTLETTKCRLGGKMGVYKMPSLTDIEIDEPLDWQLVETILVSEKSNAFKLNQIKAIVLDVDGTLTDGGMYYNSDGEELKKFNTRDAHGMMMLKKKGLKLAIITAEDSPRVDARIRKLNIEDYYKGIKDKLPVLTSLAAKWGVPLGSIAYVGDDEGDFECLENVGFSACPNDASEGAKLRSSYVCNKDAGFGAVREVCELIAKYVKS